MIFDNFQKRLFIFFHYPRGRGHLQLLSLFVIFQSHNPNISLPPGSPAAARLGLERGTEAHPLHNFTVRLFELCAWTVDIESGDPDGLDDQYAVIFARTRVWDGNLPLCAGVVHGRSCKSLFKTWRRGTSLHRVLFCKVCILECDVSLCTSNHIYKVDAD